MDSPFLYKMTLHQGANTGTVTASWVQKLPLIQQVTDQVVVMPNTEGGAIPGVYVWSGTRWRFLLPYVEIAQAIIDGSTIDVFYNMAADFTDLSHAAVLWRNGTPASGTTVVAGGDAVWCGVTKKQSGDVASVNGVQPDEFGNVVIPSSGLKTVSSQSPDVNGNVVIKAQDANGATGTSLIVGDGSGTGVVRLKTIVAGVNVTMTSDVNGNIVLNAAGGGGSGGGLAAVVNEGTGTSLVDNDGTTGGIATIKSLQAGAGITITPSGDNKTLNLTAVSTYVLPVATSTVLGGVKQGLGVTIAGDGTITALGSVTAVGAGTSIINDDGSTTHAAKLKTLVAGTGVTLSSDANTVTINASSAYTLPTASATVLGGVKVGAGLAIDGSGVLSATGGGGAVTSVNTKTGAVSITGSTYINVDNSGSNIVISLLGAIADAPNDGTLYGRQNMAWTAIPDIGTAITSVTGQVGASAIKLVEDNPPAHSAIIKSLIAGNNVSITEINGLVTITASIPSGTVATVNSKAPDVNGNVVINSSDVGALPLAGGTMQGAIAMAGFKVSGLPTPTVAGDAVPLSYLQGLTIDNGTYA